MKLDNTDKKLLFLLDQDARARLTELAGKLRLSREAVNYRIRKMEKNGTLRGFVTKLNPRKLGLINFEVFLKLNNLNATSHSKLIEELRKYGFITWMASLGGGFDLMIEITAPSPAEFDVAFSTLLDKYSKNISNYHISTRVFQYTYEKKYLWSEKITHNAGHPARYSQETSIRLDALDKKILSAIATDARLPIIDLSRKIKEAPSTVSFRLRQLEQKGIIEGYMTFSRARDFGYNSFKALITVRNFSKDEERKLLLFSQAHPNIYYFTKTLGNWNFEMDVEVGSPQEYQQFLMDFRSKFGDLVQDIESFSIFEEHKFTMWPY